MTKTSMDKYEKYYFKTRYEDKEDNYLYFDDEKFQIHKTQSLTTLGNNMNSNSTRREATMSAYLGETTQAYLVSKGNVVTKEWLWQSFRQIAAVFGWELHGHLSDSTPPQNR